MVVNTRGFRGLFEHSYGWLTVKIISNFLATLTSKHSHTIFEFILYVFFPSFSNFVIVYLLNLSTSFVNFNHILKQYILKNCPDMRIRYLCVQV